MRVEAADRPLDHVIMRRSEAHLLGKAALLHSLIDASAQRRAEEEGQQRSINAARVLDLLLVERAVARGRHERDRAEIIIDGRMQAALIDVVRLAGKPS